MPKSSSQVWTCLTIATVLAVGTLSPAEAAKRTTKATAKGTVTAVNLATRQSITAPVRNSRFGQEVRLPGGTWIDCNGDCRETLRLQTVDFWEWMERRDHQNR